MVMVKHGTKVIYIDKEEYNNLIKINDTKAQYKRIEEKYNIKIESLIVATELDNCWEVYYFRKVSDPENYPLYKVVKQI